jgi:hypothetical protein
LSGRSMLRPSNAPCGMLDAFRDSLLEVVAFPVR